MAEKAVVDQVVGDTFAKLMLEHVRLRPQRIAMRWKDLGIWQTWTWAETGEEVMTF